MTFFSSPRLKVESHKDLSQSPYRIVESKPDDQLLLQAERRCKLNMTMGQIIYCSDLVLRIDEHEEVHNITEWLYESTDYRPINPDGCVIRHEMTTMGKLSVILVVWIALIVLTTFYCYFCEQRLFPSKRLQESQAGQNFSSEDGDHEIDTLAATTLESKAGGGHFQSNIISSAAALPKDNLRSRKERLASTCSCNSVASSSITGSVGPYRRF